MFVDVYRERWGVRLVWWVSEWPGKENCPRELRKGGDYVLCTVPCHIYETWRSEEGVIFIGKS